MPNCGFPLTQTMVKAFACAIAKCSGNEKRFNAEWSRRSLVVSLFKKHDILNLHFRELILFNVAMLKSKFSYC